MTHRTDAARAGHPTTDHDVHVWNAPGGHRWLAECDSCGWRSPAPQLSEHLAREVAATHHIGGDSDDGSRGLLAAMLRHPAGKAAAQ